jgi:hypothetical protein
MQKLSPILALAVAMMASSCVSQSRVARYPGSSRPSVWEQSSVAYNTGIYPGSIGDRYQYSSFGIYESPQGGHRLYTGVSGIPDTTRLYTPAQLAYSPPSPESNASSEGRRLTGPSTSRSLTPRSEMVPAYRSALSQINDSWRRHPLTTRTSSAADRLASASSSQKTEASPPPQPDPVHRESATTESSTPDSTKLPFAQPVPGRSGYVKLSDHPNLPEIDVRGIAPGTPVEVPDPGQSGNTIQFRVP